MKAILGKKIGMTQVLNKSGVPTAATIVKAGPCFVSYIKTAEKDGYNSIQLAFDERKKIKKPQKNHLKNAKIDKNLKIMKEFRGELENKLELGAEVKADIFEEGDKVNVVGTSKGKGFAGVIKRHGFHRGPESHGSHHHRKPGSIGSMFPQKVMKGKKMPGHMGVDRVTIKKTRILKIEPEKNILIIRGPAPGPNKGLLQIQESK